MVLRLLIENGADFNRINPYWEFSALIYIHHNIIDHFDREFYELILRKAFGLEQTDRQDGQRVVVPNPPVEENLDQSTNLSD